MKLSEYIKQLQEIEKSYGGDIEVGVCHQDEYTYEESLVSPQFSIYEMQLEELDQLVLSLGFVTD